MRSVENFSGEGDLMTISVPQAPVHFGKREPRSFFSQSSRCNGGKTHYQCADTREEHGNGGRDRKIRKLCPGTGAGSSDGARFCTSAT